MEQTKKKKSRDAARPRRGQQNDEFSELAAQLPLTLPPSEKLDRLCAMRLSNSFIKIKHVLQQIKDTNLMDKEFTDNLFNAHIQNALGGFIFVLSEDGQVLYISPNVSENLGLQQLDITGNSAYKYVHPCDQENLAKQLGGQVPLEDMEIFDGLYCSDTSSYVKNPKQASCAELESTPHRSFSLRMKSTLTSRGKSVNINASIYRVVHCVGTIQTYRTKLGTSNGAMTRCLLAIGSPLLSSESFEVPADGQTFVTKHSLDLKVTEAEDLASDLLGYKCRTMVNTSWYLYSHMCDTKVIKECHESALKKGQAVSGYYRVLLKDGGWIWMQTKANVVYQSSTGQPQFISCVHYVISGMELGDEILSIEQLSTFKLNQKKRQQSTKREVPTTTFKKFSKSVIHKKEVAPVLFKAIPCEQIPEAIFSETDLPEDPDMPGLEFLDVEEQLQSFQPELDSRSPFIPGPFSDYDLKSRDINTLLADIDENELIDRAPYIPPPCIDKIVSFDDLSLPDLTDNYQDALQDSPPLQEEMAGNTAALMDPIDFNGQMFDYGNAKVPAHLLKKFMPMMSGGAKNDFA